MQKSIAALASTAGMVLFAPSSLLPCAHAQDSVSRNANGGNGLPGDAISPWSGGPGQRSAYVVDLAPLSTSSGTMLGIAPVLKSGKVNTDRFNAFSGVCAMSAMARPAAPFPSATYTLWTQATAGINASANDPALNQTVTPAGTASVMGLALLDFDEVPMSTTNILSNQITGAFLAFDPANPGRLYVTRVNAAVNGGAGQADRSQFGLGAIDAHGNLSFRADSFASAGPAANLLVGDNYFRVRIADRGTGLNLIDNAGAQNATAADWVLVRSGITHAVPTLIPVGIAGTSRLVGTDFLGNLETETSPSTLASTSAHRPFTTDHRGAAAMSAKALYSAVGSTGAVVTRSQGSGNRADSISVFGINAAGEVAVAQTLSLPANLTDNCDAFSWPVTGGDFRQYDSQAVFRGGAGPAAVGSDLQSHGLAAATVYNGSQAGNNSINAIAVAKFNPSFPMAPPMWTLAAWVTTNAADGKDITGDFGADGAPGTNDAGESDGIVNATDAPIGRLAALSEGTSGLQGPSLSAPAFDAAGNIYFVASVALRRLTGMTVIEDRKVALLRGVLNTGSFCYKLELVLAEGQTFAGPNSSRNYKVSWLGLADEDSVSSASLWSGNVASFGWNNSMDAALPQSAPQHLGGLALPARIIYDADSDGDYEDPTTPSGNQASADEAYNVALYIGNRLVPGSPCDGIDFNNDGVSPDSLDIEDYLSVFAGGPCSNDPNCNGIDFNNDGVSPDSTDIEAFLRVFAGGEC